MRKILFLLLLFNAVHCLAKTTVINGNLKGFSPEKIYLVIYQDGVIARDSAVVKNGQFTFRVDASDTWAARLITKDMSKKIFDQETNFYFPALQLLFFIEPGNAVSINGDYADWPVAKIAGGKSNQLLSQYYLSNKTGLLNARKAMAEAYRLKNKKDAAGFKEKQQLFLSLDKINNDRFGKLTRKHGNSIIAAFHAYEMLPLFDNENDLEAVYNRFDTHNREHAYGKAIYKRLADLKGAAIGTTVKKFAVAGKDSMITITAFRGKYVLLDFWGSWCAPCRESHPHLKELYAKYKDKGFEIIGIANEKTDDGRERWLTAIQADSIPWVHILHSEALQKNKTDLVKLFAITAYPTKILINPEGVVILKPRYGTNELDKKLEIIFGQ